jgi:hypothetical protein
MLENRLSEVLNSQLSFPKQQLKGQRSFGDALENACNVILTEHFDDVKQPRSVRSIEDLIINDTYIDHKTSDEKGSFKMPNLISVARLLGIDKPLIYNFIIYNSETKKIINTFAYNVYQLNWEHLKIQNLGKGQLQIKNMKEFLKSPVGSLSEKEWKVKLKEEMKTFYLKARDDAQKRYDQLNV